MGSDERAAEWVDPSTLTPWDRNPRLNDHAVKDVAASIERFGFGAPIVARLADRSVIAGHTRLKAAALLGLDRVPVRFLDVTERQARELALADNKLGELADWDPSMLLELERDAEVSLAALGWNAKEVADLAMMTDGDNRFGTFTGEGVKAKPVAVAVMLTAESATLLEEAIQRALMAGAMTRDDAIRKLCTREQ